MTPNRVVERIDVNVKECFSGRVILIGNALRTSSPLFGMGASMAIENAYVLAEELALCGGIQEVFSSFRQREKDRSKTVRWLSRASNSLYGLNRR